MHIADLYRAAKTFNSASAAQQGWLHEKEENQHMKKVVTTQLGTINAKLDKIDAKLDRVLQELRTRFDALGSSAVEVAESLRREAVLGGQAAHVLPDMIQATQDAMQRLSEHDPLSQHSPTVTSAFMLQCLSTMHTSIEAAVSRALVEHKSSEAENFQRLSSQLQGRFIELTAEVNAHLQEQRQSTADTAQQLEVLNRTSGGLQKGLGEVLSGLARVQAELTDLKKNQVELGRQVTVALAENAELNAMVRALTTNTHGIPTLAIVLPVVSTGWKSAMFPMRLVRDQFRLYFLCSHTHQLAPCGPKGKGYKITMTKQWVLDAAPVLRVGLVLLKLALMASGLPLPVPDLCPALIDKAMHVRYLNAALDVVAHPPDGALLGAEYTMQHTLDKIDAHDYSDYMAPGAEMRLQEGSRKAYETIKEILGRDGVNIPLTCGLRQVTHRGKTAWVLDNDATAAAWKSAVEEAAR
jgi:hypothetical protein